MELPFPKTWWVEPNLLLAGCFPGSKNLRVTEERIRALLHIGVRGFICLQEEQEVNLEGADLYKADLSGADLTGADLEDAVFDETLLYGTVGINMESVLLD